MSQPFFYPDLGDGIDGGLVRISFRFCNRLKASIVKIPSRLPISKTLSSLLQTAQLINNLVIVTGVIILHNLLTKYLS